MHPPSFNYEKLQGSILVKSCKVAMARDWLTKQRKWNMFMLNKQTVLSQPLAKVLQSKQEANVIAAAQTI